VVLKEKFLATASGGKGVLHLRDEIGPEWCGMISDESIVAFLQANPNLNTIELQINSPGGDCFTAMAIYNLLKNSGAFIDVYIDGLAASAATVIAMAGDRVTIAKNAMFMIHNCWCLIAGNADDLTAQIPLMRKIDTSMVEIYKDRTFHSDAQIRSWMKAETWFDANEAKKYGFADAIGLASDAKASVASGRYRNTPKSLIDTKKTVRSYRKVEVDALQDWIRRDAILNGSLDELQATIDLQKFEYLTR
jgi:ATP-dependent Clp protease protease subunit